MNALPSRMVPITRGRRTKKRQLGNPSLEGDEPKMPVEQPNLAYPESRRVRGDGRPPEAMGKSEGAKSHDREALRQKNAAPQCR
jgi:hypothetical protein